MKRMFLPAVALVVMSLVPGMKSIAAEIDTTAPSRTVPRPLKPQEHKWRVRLPLRPQAMVLAADQLILAGPPDLKDPTEALAALEGRKGGMLWIVSAADGKKVSESTLHAPPIYDGLAVANGCVYMATMDGKLCCLGGTP